jgi:predicted metal-dependent HD superfamily phosphohydrolase
MKDSLIEAISQFIVPINEPELVKALSLYDSPERRYHNREHILRMLETLNSPEVRKELGVFISVIDLIAVAILFHDIIYSVTAQPEANEDLSAAVGMLGAYNCFGYKNDLELGVIETLILATKHQRPGLTIAAQIVQDLDMMGFADDWAEFRATSENIIAEYAEKFPMRDVVAGRIEFLKKLRHRKVFNTKLFDEQTAKANIVAEIAVLEQRLTFL